MLCVPKLGLYVISDVFAILLLTLATARTGCNLDAAEYPPLMPRYPLEKQGRDEP